MTDEQWVWLFVNQQIDQDKELSQMCDQCKHEVSSENRCIRCGKIIDTDPNDNFVNPNFDEDRFKKLSVDDNSPNYDNDLDIGLFKQVKGSGTVGRS